MVTKKILLKSPDEVIFLLGQQDEKLKRLEKKYTVQIFVKQGGSSGDFSVIVRGRAAGVDNAVSELEDAMNEKSSPDNSGQSKEPKQKRAAEIVITDEIYTTSQGRSIRPRSQNQKKYIEAFIKNDIVVSIGPAGTGKTFLAVACALKALSIGRVSRIVITRPVVEAGEKLGFLPGDLYEKVNPYLKPLYDAFYSMLGPERFRYYREDETIEIVPLAYMRGRTLDDAFVILDEAQNTTPEQIKMFLTRLGTGSKTIITGDITQIDLEPGRRSGLVVIEDILASIDGIKFIHFDKEDVVRHPLVRSIIEAYEAWDKRSGAKGTI